MEISRSNASLDTRSDTTDVAIKRGEQPQDATFGNLNQLSNLNAIQEKSFDDGHCDDDEYFDVRWIEEKSRSR